MKNALTPQLFLITALAGWPNREQQKVLDYLREENQPQRFRIWRRLFATLEYADSL